MQSKNKTDVVAESGKQELFTMREFLMRPGSWSLRRFQISKLLEDWLGCKEMKGKYEKFEPKQAAVSGVISELWKKWWVVWISRRLS